MPICPTFAVGTRASIPETMPSPALNIGTTASFLPTIIGVIHFSIGVSTSTSQSTRSPMASNPSSIAISSTNFLNSLVPVFLSRRSDILCLINGCSNIVIFFSSLKFIVISFSFKCYFYHISYFLFTYDLYYLSSILLIICIAYIYPTALVTFWINTKVIIIAW